MIEKSIDMTVPTNGLVAERCGTVRGVANLKSALVCGVIPTGVLHIWVGKYHALDLLNSGLSLISQRSL